VIPASVASTPTVSSGHPATLATWIAFIVVAVVLAWGPLCVWWTLGRGKHGGGGESDDGDTGGGGWGGGHSPPKTPPEADPEWWPEFEREFAEHVHSRVRGTERCQALPAEPAP
jgi:hypothetical protein